MSHHARATSAAGLASPAKPSHATPSKASKTKSDLNSKPPAVAPQPPADDRLGQFLEAIVKFFASLRLTVVCLSLGMALVFWGTLAQVELGLFKAQNEFFRSFFIYWGPAKASWRIPIFPGGYLVGGVLLINLVTAHFSRFRLT